MVTVNKQKNDVICEIYCSSTDTKPTENIQNGASCIEVDTGNFYFFDRKTDQWVYQFCIQG